VYFTVSQNKTSPSFISRSLVKHCSILIIFGRNIPEKMQLDGVILFLTSPNCVSSLLEETKKVKFYQFSCDSTVSFSQSNVKSALLVHRKYGASSDSAQSKINVKFLPLCANTSLQIFSPLIATDTISNLLKVGRVYSRWFGEMFLCLVPDGA